jgi:hypothetical protein
MADISSSLKSGLNEIEVRVSTPLKNRLYLLHKAVADRGLIQEYGLVGPVIFQPFKRIIVWEK